MNFSGTVFCLMVISQLDRLAPIKTNKNQGFSQIYVSVFAIKYLVFKYARLKNKVGRYGGGISKLGLQEQPIEF